MLHNEGLDGRASWAAGAFHEADVYGNSVGGGHVNATARLTALPLRLAEDGGFVHVGAALSTREPVEERARYRAKPEMNMAPWFVDTRDPSSGEDIRADRVNLAQAEIAGSFGPVHFQSEYAQSTVGEPAAGCAACGADDIVFWGFSAQAGYVLTGEHRGYDSENGRFLSVVPATDFLRREGLGGWEVVVRYSLLDLGEADTVEGRLSAFTVGLNWYAAPQARVFVNLVMSDLEGSGTATGLMARLQAGF